MLEPVAATVLNTLLSGRPLAGHHPTSHTALKMITRASGSALPPDFFTPRPRRPKGKERASPDHLWNACRTSPGPAPDVSARRPALMPDPASAFRDVSPHRHLARRIPVQGTMHVRERNEHPSFLHLASADYIQRRHASNLPEAVTASSSSPDTSHWRHLIIRYSSGATDVDTEVVWQAYEALYDSGASASVDQRTLLKVGTRIAAMSEDLRAQKNSRELLQLWGTRLGVLLDRLGTFEQGPDPGTLRRRCLAVAAHAMVGHMDAAILGVEELHQNPPEEPHERVDVVEMYTTLIAMIDYHQDSVSALKLVIEEWSEFGLYLHRGREGRSPGWMKFQPLRVAVLALRTYVHHMVNHMEQPSAFMEDYRVKRWTTERRRTAGEYLIQVLCALNMAHDAHLVFEHMQQHSLSVPIDLQFGLVVHLARADAFEPANKLFASLSRFAASGPEFVRYQKLGLHLYARQGYIARAYEFFNRLAQHRWVSSIDMAIMLHAHAVKGDVGSVVKLFHQFFSTSRGKTSNALSPNITHYTPVILAHAQRGDLVGINSWLATMKKAGFSPDAHIYNMILKCLADRGDIAYMTELLEQMRAAGMAPSHTAFTTVLSVLAKRRDSVAAEKVYKLALRNNVVPDRRMLAALMNVYVEAGQWDGVIRVFDFISSFRRKDVRLTIEIYNTLLKAYVLIGAPFRVVANLFQKLEESGLRPDTRTFALLIQSACDSELMDIACDLFAEMEKKSEDWQAHFILTPHVFTILLAGHLRKGKQAKAKEMFDLMRARNIQPTAVTYAAIVKAYSKELSGAGLQVAERVVKSLTASDSDQSWMKTSTGREQALDTLFAPLLTAYARREKPERIEDVIRDVEEAGGEPTLGMMTALLDAYRRIGNAGEVRKLWPQIYDLGLRYARVSASFTTPPDSAANLEGYGTVMCIPLSIYIDSLSAAGYHAEIAQTWKTLQDAKLAFDSHNWNHLVVALVRAGELERAFEVVEHVILRSRRNAADSLAYHRDDKPTSPLRQPPSDDMLKTQSELLRHVLDRRVQAVRTATKKSSQTVEEGKPHDFAHALHILYQVSPLWDVWRPHDYVLSTLSDVLRHLESGQLVQPVRPDTVDVDDDWTTAAPTIMERRRIAAEILGRIRDKYPRTVSLVQDHIAVSGREYRRLL